MFKKFVLKKIKYHLKKTRLKNNLKLKQLRNEYIKRLNHDIKTPILAHIQTLELFNKESFGTLTKEQKEILNEILKSHYFILQIIINTIFILNCENNNYKLNFEKINLLDEINDCIGAIKNYATEKEQKIIIKNPKEIKLNGDRKLIQKIIYNILQSSIDCGNKKSNIVINLKENNNFISFSAKNKSIYMTKEKIESLFDEKNDSVCDFNQLGMSLNLNIAKKLIKAHNWDIIAKSKKDNSSTFGFLVVK